MSLFNYHWYLKDNYDVSGVHKHRLKVFGTFICGGGSSMGYKLAGFNHLGGVEIDKAMSDVYQANHNPKYLYREDIRLFKNRTDIPDELYKLDILDGSPPCSSFSMSGNREKDWGKKKKFREGQASQTLDDLFFDYIDLINKLQPKVALAENVKGMLIGNAKAYLKAICNRYGEIGYDVQVFLLNATTMGVPQRRERIFIIARRKDLGFKPLTLSFNEAPIPIYKAFKGLYVTKDNKSLTELQLKLWTLCKPGNSLSTVHPRGSWFNQSKLSSYKVSPTLTSKPDAIFHFSEPRLLHKEEACAIQTFPLDYNFPNKKHIYICGMSVPPVMTAQVANQIYNQWFKE